MPEQRERSDYYNQREAAAALDMSVMTIKRAVAAGRLTPHVVARKYYYLKTDVDALKAKQYPAGLTYAMVGERFGVSTNTVKKQFKRLNVQPAGFHRALKGVVFDLDTVDSTALSLGWLRNRSNGS